MTTHFPPGGSSASSTTGCRVLVVGDSISEPFGIPEELGWVQLLAQRLERFGCFEVMNRSATGRTASEARELLPRWLRELAPNVLILQLGANDGFSRTEPARIQENLRSMIDMAHAVACRPVVAGMKLPYSTDPDYARCFLQVYQQLAVTTRVPVLVSLLRGVGTESTLMQPDGRHPNAAGQRRILDNLWPKLERVLSTGGQIEEHGRAQDEVGPDTG